MFQRIRSSVSRALDRHPTVKRPVNWLRRRKKRLISLIILLAHTAGALTSVRAIMEVRTSQGAIAWAIALNTLPYVSVPAYWVFGRSKFHGYVLTRQKDLAETSPTARKYVQDLKDRGLLANSKHDKALLIERLAQMRFTIGNDAELLIDGSATFQSIFEGIAQAKEYVLVEFYIM
ncbi:MAG TPA: PLDc N-terminal domain-containing protein, partial [Candidatus Saccharimonadia bacterium]|nr:PLDc N-terminal domain-containing protein [Candidatus Saccharimonadia bacterium]